MRAYKLIASAILVLLLAGCVRTTFLKNGHTHVATNPKVYKNRKYFDKSILTQLDTTAIYEAFETSYYSKGGVKQPPILARLNYDNPNTIYGIYRFYGNGCFSCFTLDRDDAILTKEMFDPTINGWRGILYTKKNLIKGDMITQTSGISSMIGIITKYFQFCGDTLFVTRKETNSTEVFIKRKISSDLLQHNADW